MVKPQRKHEEFFNLFKKLDGHQKQELIPILGKIASNSKQVSADGWELYLSAAFEHFGITGHEHNEDFNPMPAGALIDEKALAYFALMEDKYQVMIVNGLKGMVQNGIC